ncbi:riboflavin synthase [Candidatus Daviesbacteria bacterium]|nr:riboflavin synthase [Candidatus Daviesbacteria bacterium]
MFTGIITNLGKVITKTNQTLTISTTGKFLSKLKKGTSISVNGICLTVVNITTQDFAVNLMPETIRRTNITKADLVNLELPVTPQSFLSGHLVQGHIDGIGKIEQITSQSLKVALKPNLARYLIDKGSVSVNGIALTVIKAGKNYFTVGIIPHTFTQTNLHTLKKGGYVNIEVDILAKYVKKYCHSGN